MTVKIEQRHRDAAADLMEAICETDGSPSSFNALTRGEDDNHYVVQALARFEAEHMRPEPADTKPEAISPPDAQAVVEALDELDGSDFEAVRRHSATLRAALQSTGASQ